MYAPAHTRHLYRDKLRSCARFCASSNNPYRMPPSPTDPRSNSLLAAIPQKDWERFSQHLSPVALDLGLVLHEPGREQFHMYFPTDAIISLIYVLESGASAEIAIVGREGMVGTALFMGGIATPTRAVVQSAGQGFRIPAAHLREEFARAGPIQDLLLRFTQSIMVQMGQTAVCNRHHNVDQQLCRWLLMSLDRLSTDQLSMTQELIGNMLGVRREAVTEAAGKLQRAGIIQYARGRILVLDRPRLEELSCECYEVVRHELDRLLPWSNVPQLDDELVSG